MKEILSSPVLRRIVLPLGIGMLFLWGLPEKSSGASTGEGVLALLALALLCYGGWQVWRWLNSCPKCNLWGVAEKISSAPTGTSESLRDGIVKDHTKNEKGDILWTKEKNVVNLVTTTHWKNTIKCKSCGHRWETRSTTEEKQRVL
jgi:transcription elongation factor Elf1